MTSTQKTRIRAMNNCITETNEPVLVVEGKKEEKSKLIFKNKKRDLLVKIKLNGCYCKESVKKCCSYLVRHKGINYYIELKAVSYEDAFMKIVNAINQFNKKDFGNDTCKAIVVTRKSPAATDFQRALRRSKLRQYICGAPIREISPYKHPLS